MVERDQTSVHLGADAGVTDLGVDVVREIDRGRSDRQRHDLALGCEDVDLVLFEIGLQVRHELGGVGDLGLPVDQAVEPVDVGLIGVVVLVGPVGGDAPLRTMVHLLGADLDLDRSAVRPDHGGVQALVEVELRDRDVVLEAAGHGPPPAMDRSERGVAVLDRVDDHPDGHDVEDVVELAALDDHLLVDAPQVLAPTGDLALDAELVEPLLDLGDCLGQVGVSLGGARRDQVVELRVALRVQRRERQILELLLDLLDAEPVGQRGVDVEGLLGDAALLVGRHAGERSHVVEPVGELDDEHPEVFRHRDEHLAHRGRLLLLAGVEADALELGDAVDDPGDLVTELIAHVAEGDLGVLDGVVQQRGRHRCLVETDVGHDLGDRQGMVDVALAAGPALVVVSLGRGVEGPVDRLDAVLGVVGPVGLEQRYQLTGRVRALSPPGKDSIDGRHGVVTLLLLVAGQALDSVTAQFVTAAETVKFDHHRHADDVAAEGLDEAGRRQGRAAGGEDVVDDQDGLVGVDGVTMDLELVGAVLELVLLTCHGPGQLAGLADGDEPGPEPVRHRCRENEAA